MRGVDGSVTPRVAVIMGSKSDWATMQRATETLAELDRSAAITVESERQEGRRWT